MKYIFYAAIMISGLIFYNLDKDHYIKEKEKNQKYGKLKINNMVASLIPNLGIPSINTSINDFIPSPNIGLPSVNSNTTNLLPNIEGIDITAAMQLPVSPPSGEGLPIPSLAPAFQMPNDLKSPVQAGDAMIDFVDIYSQSLKDAQENIPITLPSL